MKKHLLLTSALLIAVASVPAVAQDKGSGAMPDMKKEEMKKDAMPAPMKMEETKGSAPMADPMKKDDMKGSGTMAEPMKKDEMKGSGSMPEKK